MWTLSVFKKCIHVISANMADGMKDRRKYKQRLKQSAEKTQYDIPKSAINVTPEEAFEG